MQEFLSSVLLFAGLSNEDLARLGRMVEEIHLTAGQKLFKEGTDGQHAYVIWSGQMEVYKETSEGTVTLAVLESRDILGEMSLVEHGPRTASARAKTDATLLVISRNQFYSLLENSSAAALAMLHTIIKRLRATEHMLRENEKLAQLGTITASVAQELDAPAENTQKGAEQLRDVMGELAEVRLRLYQLNLSNEQIKHLFDLERRLYRQAKTSLKVDAIEQRDLEIQIETVLADLGVMEAMNLAPMLVNLGYNGKQLATLAQNFTTSELLVVLVWLSKAYQMYTYCEQVRQGAMRVFDISQALKTYSDMEETNPEEFDLYDELEDALMNFRNELKAGVRVQRDYDKNLPTIYGYPEELNQVFVHVIDNAIAAMKGYGKITVRTYREKDFNVVEIEDDGPGIPSEIQRKVFDPFFTTKEPGEGMGLGLHISQKIITQKHGGDRKSVV